MNPVRTYDYLLQSREHLFSWLAPLSPEQYASEHPIGLGSLARTLHHVHAAEWSYMHRVRGVTEPLPAAPQEHDPEVTTENAMPFAQLEAAWRAQGKSVRTDIVAVEDWDTPHVYTTMWEGAPYAYRASRADVFAQLVLHEVHHRAQAMHMLRRLGVETGEIDYNALMWKRVEA